MWQIFFGYGNVAGSCDHAGCIEMENIDLCVRVRVRAVVFIGMYICVRVL